MERVALDNDIKYIDRAGNLFRTRAELSISKMLSFLGQNFEYDVMLKFKNDDIVNVDFKIDDKYIEVIDCENDVNKFLRIRRELPEIKIIAVGHSKYAGKVNELDSFFFFNYNYSQTGSIFIEDPSLAFDYAHILPLVKKCSILHGHTSTVMVEIIGKMENGLVIDFSEAKRLIKEAINDLDHKFFINSKYLFKEDYLYYYVRFNGPQGYFDLQMPKSTVYILPDEATVESLSKEIIRILAPKMPKNIEALGVYIYEGVNKGAHILANV